MSKPMTNKPVVSFKRIDDVEDTAYGTQRVSLTDIKGHPKLGDTDWVHTSSIVAIETRNTRYEVDDS